MDPTNEDNVVNTGPPAVSSTINEVREEEVLPLSTNGQQKNDGDGSNSIERSSLDNAVLKTRKGFLKFGTWNVRTLYQSGKVENCCREMQRLNIDLLGMAEIRWTDSGVIDRGSHLMIFSGGKKHENGVGFMMTRKISNAMQGYLPISNRVIVAKFAARPVNIVCVQVYAPTSEHSDEEIEAFYDDVEKAIKTAKSSDIVIIMGDLNAKVGNEKVDNVTGKYGLGLRNDRGSRLVQFCQDNNLTIMNTVFQQPPRRLYTWKSPGDTYRNQIDYIMVNNRYKNSVKSTCTYPGADINSDHCLLIMKLKHRMKTNMKIASKRHMNLNLLSNETIKNAYSIAVNNRYEILSNEDIVQEDEGVAEDVNQQYENIKSSIIHGLEETVPKKDKQKRQIWMTDEILEKMDKRRELKKHTEEYREMEAVIRANCKVAKEEWYSARCEEIEDLEKKHHAKELHQKVKDLTDRKRNIRTGNGCIKDKDGNLLFEKRDVENRWVEYISELYDDTDRNEDIMLFEGDRGPIILREEVAFALKKMKSGKAVGPDEIPTEALKALEGISLQALTELCNKIYRSGHIPSELMKSTFIKLPKKPNALDCAEHRTISLMSHLMKLLLKIILTRNDQRIENEISACQSGFRPKMGTREGIFNLRTIIERFLEKQKTVFICFIDYEKAFDRVYHEKIIECLNTIDMDNNDKRLITSLYWNQTASVQLEYGASESFKIKRGVRQGCVLSPKLFNLYTEHIFREVEDLPGCIVGGTNFNNLRYADDTALIAESEEELQVIVDQVRSSSEVKGLRMNVKKTKTMAISRDRTPEVKIVVKDTVLEQVKIFKYLGQLITDDGKCEREVRGRIEIARARFVQMKDVLTSRQLSLDLRKRMVRCYILSTFLYASETWTLNKILRDKIEAFEMWVYRRMLKISYEQHRTNEEVLRMACAKRSLLHDIERRKILYFGHVVRAEGTQRLLMEGTVEGVRRKGKQRRKWTTDVTEWMELSYAECTRLAYNRKAWRIRAANLLRRRHP